MKNPVSNDLVCICNSIMTDLYFSLELMTQSEINLVLLTSTVDRINNSLSRLYRYVEDSKEVIYENNS